MRITSGIYKGRVIQRVDTELTRETSDKVKQAMFNMLFDVKNQVVLDLFAGS
ncbi:MAG: RsmD family RNA methyltransferase [Acholeplasmataceae bacterium]